MSAEERAKSRSPDGSPKQDSWYTLVQEDTCDSSPSPSPPRSTSTGSSRASSKVENVSSTPGEKQHPSTSATDEAKDAAPAHLESSTLSQHPLEDESGIQEDVTAAGRSDHGMDQEASVLQSSTLSQHPIEDESQISVSKAEGSPHATAHGGSSPTIPPGVISPLGGFPDGEEDRADGHFVVPPIDLNASLASQGDGRLTHRADVTGGITRETFPFVEDDSGTMASSDTDIPVPLSDVDDTEGNMSDGTGRLSENLPLDAVQEAIAEVSADFVSGALQMSMTQHSSDAVIEDRDSDRDIDSRNNIRDLPGAHSSAATTPWQSEGGTEQLTPSPVQLRNIANGRSSREQTGEVRNLMADDCAGIDYSNQSKPISNKVEHGRIISSVSPAISSAENTMTKGSPSNLPSDIDNLQPLDNGEHVSAGAAVIFVNGSDIPYQNREESIHSLAQGRGSQQGTGSSMTDRLDLLNDQTVTPSQGQRVVSQSASRDSLPFKYLSPTEADAAQSKRTDIQRSQNIGFSSDSESHSSGIQLDGNRDRNSRGMDVHQVQRGGETERDLLARRVALLLQVSNDGGSDHKGIVEQRGALSGSASSSNTGSPDSIEEASLPMRIMSRDGSNSSAAHRRGDGQSFPPVSRSVSSSSSSDSLAEHVKRLLQESESLRKLHEAGIDTRQLLNIQTEIGKSSPTISEASTSSSVREIINRVTKHAKADHESDDGYPAQDEVFMTPSPSGSMTVPMGSGSGRSRDSSGLRDSNKVTFQQTFQSNRSRESVRSAEASHSSSTLTYDSLSQKVQHLLNVTDKAAGHSSHMPSESLSKEDLLALMQMSELERKVSEGNLQTQRQFSPRSVQNSQVSSTRDGGISSASGRDISALSADSLALRVQAILGQEAPRERVDRIISEALSSVDPSTLDRNQSNVSLGSRYSTAKSNTSISPRDSVADLIQQPYGAFEKARDLLSLHLQRIADRTFDHSVDTRTPYRQDTNANIVNMRHHDAASVKSSQRSSDHDFKTTSSGSLGRTVPSDHVMYGLLPEQMPSHLQMAAGRLGEYRQPPKESSASKHKSWHGEEQLLQHPQLSRLYSGGQRNENVSKLESSMDDSLFAVTRSNSSPEIKVDKQLAKAASSHQRSGSWGRSPEFKNSQQAAPTSKLPIPSHVSAAVGQARPEGRPQQQEYHSEPKSQTPQHLPSQQQQPVHQEYSTNSWPRSLSKSKAKSYGGAESKESPRTQSRQSQGNDSLLRDGFLRPYRPPGSSGVIYTYPIEGQGLAEGSPTVSNSTMESSHTGSDDAHAPRFPETAYGTRASKDSSATSPHSSKIPRYSSGIPQTSSPQRIGQVQGEGPTNHLENRRYARSFSDSSWPETQDEKRVGQQHLSLSPQHTYGRPDASTGARPSGKKRGHSWSPPELAQVTYESRQTVDSQKGAYQRNVPGSRLPVKDFTTLDQSAGRRGSSPEKFGYGVPAAVPRPGWTSTQQGQQVGPPGGYYPEGPYSQQYPLSGGVTNAHASNATSPTKRAQYRLNTDQSSMKYPQAVGERDGRRQYQQYGPGYHPEVPQLPGTFSRRVLEDILQNEADPLYHEASMMWDQYQRLQQQKEAFKEARREMRGDESSDLSSLDSRRVNRLAHFVQDPVRHTVEQLVQDDTDGETSSTMTDSTPRQRKKWDRDQQFTPREQSPDKNLKPLETFQMKVSPEDIAAIVQTSSKESKIPRSTNRQQQQQQQQQEKRKMPDDKRHSKHSRGAGYVESTLTRPHDDTAQELLSDLATSEQSLLNDMSLESDRLLQLLGPDGIRKLSSKLVKLQRKIDRQREAHRKREEEQKGENVRRGSSKRKGQQEDVPFVSTPAVEDLTSSAVTTSLGESSDVANGRHLQVGNQASLEPCLSPVQEASSTRSTEASVYDTAESSPPDAPLRDSMPERHKDASKRRSYYAHRDDFGVTYNTDSLSDVCSDTSIPCACRPTRSHSIHGMTKRSREKATGRMSKETNMDVERDEVFKKPSKEGSRHESRIPVRDPDVAKRRNMGATQQQVQERPQKLKPGTAFIVDVGQHSGVSGQAKDTNVLTRRQNYSNKDVEADEERRRRRSEKKENGAKENEAPSRIPKKIVQPVAWFQPLSKKMAWQQDTPTKAKPQPITIPVKTEEEVAKANEKASLQEAFERFRSDFISKSRERQRKVKLAAEERQVQAQYEMERAQIFHDPRSKKPNPNAHPLSDQLHKPKKRALSKKQMKEQTEKLYNRLPEVKDKEKERKKVQESELNRIRAQMYRKKLSDKVKRKPWAGN